MSSISRGRAAAVVSLVLAFLVVAVALFGTQADYAVLDRPILLGTVAAILVTVSGLCAFGRQFLWSGVAFMLVWAVVAAFIRLHIARFPHSSVPHPTNPAVEAVLLVHSGSLDSVWELAVRREDGWWTREWTAMTCLNTDSGGPPEVTWISAERLRVRDLVIDVNPATGRPRTVVDGPDRC
ncbi:hypothetical protein GCM10010517_63230 [Streptosporangium fragile]|uniref:Uncharacterized protein n=1 Tax=Streptosporangium fragile TaxID=46186 RepID=A0ABN3W649_9ACTN